MTTTKLAPAAPVVPQPAAQQGGAVAHMYPSDLERFRKLETIATAFSVAVSNPDERSVPLYTAPPARQAVALTDAEKDDLAREMVKGGKSVNWLCDKLERAFWQANNLAPPPNSNKS